MYFLTVSVDDTSLNQRYRSGLYGKTPLPEINALERALSASAAAIFNLAL